MTSHLFLINGYFLKAHGSLVRQLPGMSSAGSGGVCGIKNVWPLFDCKEMLVSWKTSLLCVWHERNNEAQVVVT